MSEKTIKHIPNNLSNKGRSLTEKEKELILDEYNKGELSIRKLALMYGVSKTTIHRVVFPRLYEEEKAKKREQHKIYYDKDKTREYMRRYRQRLKEIGE